MKTTTNGQSDKSVLGNYYFSLNGYEDITEALQFNDATKLNSMKIPQELIIEINKLIEFNLKDLGIGKYEIVQDNKSRSIEMLKKNGIKYVMYKNDLGEICIDSVDVMEGSHLYTIAYRGHNNRAFVLLQKNKSTKSQLEETKKRAKDRFKTAMM